MILLFILVFYPMVSTDLIGSVAHFKHNLATCVSNKKRDGLLLHMWNKRSVSFNITVYVYFSKTAAFCRFHTSFAIKAAAAAIKPIMASTPIAGMPAPWARTATASQTKCIKIATG